MYALFKNTPLKPHAVLSQVLLSSWIISFRVQHKPWPVYRASWLVKNIQGASKTWIYWPMWPVGKLMCWALAVLRTEMLNNGEQHTCYACSIRNTGEQPRPGLGPATLHLRWLCWGMLRPWWRWWWWWWWWLVVCVLPCISPMLVGWAQRVRH